ncbi:N-acetylmuramoyl-L-alanine amidase [Vagococcus xieshaowenii]|uniref:N-acetylmuramoyl-L-alanine amidase n=1 Tax=Vagococcus xieshaowenii TaxID=2562451 RepID=A0AAJ5EHB0_9ENTE|nr:N-acetylmuramoyl-L-alanine amidase [Vagococcus xieshaowenii]QCA29214.1 N-acetylmuramoyl-L-alanine amidase [Vagococcus xieshaowenii]TFZ43273.1 N-acetylmuramoyl-L-alanine amidase [Vagococcus xieshaowenii]
MLKKILKKPTIKLLMIHLAMIAAILLAFVTYKPKDLVTIETLALNVRLGPGLDYDITSQVKKGDKVEVLEEKDKWFHVVLPNSTKGWIASWLIAENSASTAVTSIKATVNTDDTNLREKANTDSDVVVKVKKDTPVLITNEANGWSQVEVDGKSGWIFSDLLTLTEEKNKENPKDKPITTKPTIKKVYARQDDIKIRQEASIDGLVIATSNIGQPMDVVAEEGDWYQVKTEDGQIGYVANWVVSTAKQLGNSSVSSIAEATIMLDPGHGGTDVGSISPDETIYEKTITFATANYVKEALQTLGANVMMTRSDDVLVPLSEIANKSNRASVDAFISFHYDSTEGANTASGTKTYYYDDTDKLFASIINNSLAETLPLPNRGVDFGDYQVLRENDRPAVLLELGFMNNSNDLAEFSTKSYQKKVAQAVAQALTEYFE